MRHDKDCERQMSDGGDRYGECKCAERALLAYECRRFIKQIAVAGHAENSFTQSDFTVIALDNHGDVWAMNNRNDQWTKWPALPQEAE